MDYLTNMIESSTDESDSEVEYEEFEPSQDKYIHLNETFNQHKLNHIIQNENLYTKKLRPKYFDREEEFKPFAIMRRYLENSTDGVHPTTYRQNNGLGRFYAEASESLQNLPREVRHTISAEHYIDLDMVNAHPVILRFLCKKMGVKCKYLSNYVDNRDEHLSTLGVGREQAKTAMLSLINGGCKAFNKLPTRPVWLVKFKKEMMKIHKHFAVGRYYEEHLKKRIEEGTTFNHEASYMNKILCEYENRILQVIYNGLERPDDCVLCFDGIMLRDLGSKTIEDLEDLVKKEIGITIQLKVKPMLEGLELPADIPKYIKPTYNKFDFNDSYTYYEFRKEFNNKHFKSLDALKMELEPKYKRVVSFILAGKGFFIKKMKDTMDTVDTLGKSGFNMTYDLKTAKGKTKKVSVKLETLLTEYGINFENIGCALTDINYREFNTFAGFQAQRFDKPMTEETKEGLSLIIDLVKVMWADNDEVSFKYIMSWLAGLFDTSGINKKSLVMISPQGCGKGTLVEFMELLLRKANVYNTVGISSIAQKHNTAIQGKRLIVVNEMSSTRDEFKSNFDKIKSYITDHSISIEPKGVNPYSIDNIGNYLLFTNHVDSVYIEKSDRRYGIFEMGKKYMKDTNQFRKIREMCFNQDVADAFYTYLLDFDKADLNIIPETKLRKEMIELSLPSGLKFLKSYVEDEDNEREVKASIIYEKYTYWCSKNGERALSSTKFGLQIRDKIKKSRKNYGMVYEILP